MGLVLFCVLVLAAELKGLHAEGPTSPLVAQLGGSVLLPCSTQDPLPLEGLRVEWRRTDSESVVNVLQQKDIRADLQSETFRGRANFFPEEISKGNFSILLSDITREDAGVYRCGVHFNQDLSETTVEIQLSERLVVTGALHPIFTSVGEEVILNCSVDSHIPVHQLEEVTWKKHPDIPVLLFQENQTFSDFSQESYRGRVKFFMSEIPHGNFSLNLKDVRMEDKGEFICEVHMADASAQTTVVIQQIGFSSLQIFILVLSFISLSLSVGLGVPVFIFLQKQETDRWVMIMDIVLALCPNICMFTAFVLWSTEGLLGEVVICAVLSLTRCLMFLKTSPYLYTLPDCLVKEIKTLTVQLQYLIIAAALMTVELVGNKHISISMVQRSLTWVGIVIPGAFFIITAKFHLRMHSFLSMELCNAALFTIIIQGNPFSIIDVFVTLSSLFFGMVLVFSLQTYFFQQKPFKWIHIGLSSAAVTTICIYNIIGFIIVGISAGSFAFVWMLPFVSALYITVWVVMVFVVRCKRPCCRRRGLGYLLCAVLLSITVAMFGIMSIYFITESIKNRDISGHCAVLALLHILTASALLDHPEKIQKLPHTILHLFGSSGLSIITSITLVTELILKPGTGLRTLPELHLIILPFDSLFTLGWITLQTYNSWLKMRSRIKSDFEDGRKADIQVGEGGEEMEVLSSQLKSPEDDSVM